MSTPDSPTPKTILWIDGDGPQEISETEVAEKLLDLVMNNPEVTFKRREITLMGQPITSIEVE